MSLERLKESLKTGEFCRLYYLYGDEAYLKRFYLQSVKEKLFGDGDAQLNYYETEGKDSDPKVFAEFMDRFPAFGGRKLAILADVPLTSDLGNFLVQHPEVYNEDTVVIVYGKTVQYDERTKDYKAFAKVVAEYGMAVRIDLPADHILQAWVMQHCKKMGSEISLPDAQYFLSITEKNMDFMIRELQKLTAYCDGNVTRDSIDKLCIRTAQTEAFALSNAITAKDAKRAADVLDRLKRNRTPAQMTLGSLYYTVAQLYKGKLAEVYGGDFGPYQRYRAVIRSKPLATFERAVSFCAEIDRAMKRNAGDDDVLLTELTMGLIALL